MIIFPAIDIRGGRCVRLIQGSFDREVVYDDDPVKVAKRWEAEGATHVHVVDLDGARKGEPVNYRIILDIVDAVDMMVQVGGGIRSEENVRQYLNAGVGRVVLGTMAIMNRLFVRLLCEEFGHQIVVAIDAREGVVSIDGWEADTMFLARDVAAQLGAAGCRRFIYTDIARDGMLQGPNIPALTEFARATKVPVIAAGGVSALHDIHLLKKLQPAGVEGAIIGKALYDGKLNLRDALQIAGGVPTADQRFG